MWIDRTSRNLPLLLMSDIVMKWLIWLRSWDAIDPDILDIKLCRNGCRCSVTFNLRVSLAWPLTCAIHKCCMNTPQIIEMHRGVCDKGNIPLSTAQMLRKQALHHQNHKRLYASSPSTKCMHHWARMLAMFIALPLHSKPSTVMIGINLTV